MVGNNFHTVTHCYLESLSDNVYFTKIFESAATINITWPFNFSVTLPYKYFKFTCTGKLQFGLSELKLYEATPIPRGNILQVDPNSHLKKSSDGLRISANYIETKEVKTDLMNVKHITADTIKAVGLTIEHRNK